VRKDLRIGLSRYLELGLIAITSCLVDRVTTAPKPVIDYPEIRNKWSENAQVTPKVLTRGGLGKRNIPNYTAIAKLSEVVDIYPEDAIRCCRNREQRRH